MYSAPLAWSYSLKFSEDTGKRCSVCDSYLLCYTLQRLFHGELVVGGAVGLTDHVSAEALGFLGADFVWIDGEHAPFDKRTILDHITAIDATSAASIVRVSWNDPVIIKPILEMGPDGILCPMVNTVEQAEKFVAACTYPPRGIRGFGPRRAAHYGSISDSEYIATADSRLLRMIQIEHVEAVKNLEAICDVPGIDLLIIGPHDLSGSMGILAQMRHPELLAMFDHITTVCRKKGKPFGVAIGPHQPTIEEWVKRGICFLNCGNDIAFINVGARQTINFARSLAQK